MEPETKIDPETMGSHAAPAQTTEAPAITWTRATVEIRHAAKGRWSRRSLAILGGAALVAISVGTSAVMASDPPATPAGGAIPVDASAADAAFRDFASCMRKHGIDMPDPVTVSSPQGAAGSGPVIVSGGPGAAGASTVVGSGASVVLGSGTAQAVPFDEGAFKAANDACMPILEAAGIQSGTGTIVGGDGSLNVTTAGGAGVVGVTVAGTGDVAKAAGEMKAYAACMRDRGQDVPDPVVDTKAGTVQLRVNSDPSTAAFRAADAACSTGGFGFPVPVTLPAPTQP